MKTLEEYVNKNLATATKNGHIKTEEMKKVFIEMQTAIYNEKIHRSDMEKSWNYGKQADKLRQKLNLLEIEATK